MFKNKYAISKRNSKKYKHECLRFKEIQLRM